MPKLRYLFVAFLIQSYSVVGAKAGKKSEVWSADEINDLILLSAEIKNDLLALRIMAAKIEEREAKFENKLDLLKLEIRDLIKRELVEALKETRNFEGAEEQRVVSELSQIKEVATQCLEKSVETNTQIQGFKSELSQIKSLLNRKVADGHFRSSGLKQCYGVNSGYDITPGSNDLFSRLNMDLGACCAFCKQTKGCKAFVWDKAINTCNLKAVTGPRNSSDRGVVGYPDSSVDATDQCGLVDSGLDYSPGSQFDIATNMTDLAGCCNFCKRTTECKAFVWSKSSGMCWAKSVDYPRVYSEDRISGLRDSVEPITPISKIEAK